MEVKMIEIGLVMLGWFLGMATALFIGWRAERSLRIEEDDEDANLWL